MATPDLINLSGLESIKSLKRLPWFRAVLRCA